MMQQHELPTGSDMVLDALLSLEDVRQDLNTARELMTPDDSASGDPVTQTNREAAAQKVSQAQKLIAWAQHTLNASVAQVRGVLFPPFPGEFEPLQPEVLQLLTLKLLRERGGALTIRVQDLMDQLNDGNWQLVARPGPGKYEGTWAAEAAELDGAGGHDG